MLAGSAQAQIQYVVVDSIDYSGNIAATDRTKYDDQYPAHPSVEVQGGNTYPAVYVRGDEPTVTINLLDTTGQSYSANFVVTAARYITLNSVTHTVTATPSSQSVSVNAFPSDTAVTVSVSGIPDEVSGGRLEIIGYLELTQTVTVGFTQYFSGYKFWGNSTTYQDIGDLLFTDDTPSGLQSMPWTDLLTVMCGWAEGETGAEDVMSEVTYRLFWSQQFYYDPDDYYYCSAWDDESNFTYDLAAWLSDLIDPGFSPIDCRDMAGALSLIGLSLGIDNDVTHLDTSNTFFTTNPGCGIGSDADTWTKTPAIYKQFVAFNFHVILCINGDVHDGVIAQWKDLSGAGYQNPVMGWPLSGYWQTGSSWTSPDSVPHNPQHCVNHPTNCPSPDRYTWARRGIAFGASSTTQSSIDLIDTGMIISGYEDL